MKRVWFAALALMLAFALTACDPQGSGGGTAGTVTGTVYDSTALGIALAGVSVSIVGSSYAATSDAYGAFSITAPEGTVTVHFQKTGYTFVDIVVAVVAGETASASDGIVAYRPLAAGQFRFILTWGAQPADLDSHLLLPDGAEDIYFGHEIAVDRSANLDWDDTSSYGPETITITSPKTGTYIYSIDNYSGSPDMGANSAAVVRVYDSTGLIKTLHITDAPGAAASVDHWWYVCTMNGGAFTWVNQMSASQPLIP